MDIFITIIVGICFLTCLSALVGYTIEHPKVVAVSVVLIIIIYFLLKSIGAV